MARQAKRTRKRPRRRRTTTKPIGRAIRKTIAQLRAVRPAVTPEERIKIDLNLRVLNECYSSLKAACKDMWVITS